MHWGYKRGVIMSYTCTRLWYQIEKVRQFFEFHHPVLEKSLNLQFALPSTFHCLNIFILVQYEQFEFKWRYFSHNLSNALTKKLIQKNYCQCPVNNLFEVINNNGTWTQVNYVYYLMSRSGYSVPPITWVLWLWDCWLSWLEDCFTCDVKTWNSYITKPTGQLELWCV